MEQGTKRIEQALAESKGVLPGDKAFELFDTYGFPIDLTQLMAREQGMSVDMTGFEAELQKQKERSRAATAVTTGDWVELGKGETAFIGYDELSTEARILRYRKVSGKGGDQFQLVLDRTPFYAEGGGQVGDQGWLVQGADQVEVVDTKRENQLIVHFTKELPKDVTKPLTAQVNTQRRGLTARNHTATHLLHHALRKHLGTHVEQKGSLVAPDRLRFDISHFAKVTPEELATIEREVNAMITDDIVFEDKRNVPIAEAKAMGAMALFGEKYGDNVRVVKFGPSVELCGGTHVPRTGVIGPFRIVSESALAAGIRRIEAITSVEAERMINEKLAKLEAIERPAEEPRRSGGRRGEARRAEHRPDQGAGEGRQGEGEALRHLDPRQGHGQQQRREGAGGATRPRCPGPEGPRLHQCANSTPTSPSWPARSSTASHCSPCRWASKPS